MTKPVPVHPAALLLALSALCLPAHAESVYRCGANYSTLPCAGATIVAADDARSAAQRAQADAATRRDSKLAQVLEQDRLRLEAKAAPAIILAKAQAGGATRSTEKPVSNAKLKKPEHFTAVSPKKAGEATPNGKKKKKTATA